jgi:hypothetical protein
MYFWFLVFSFYFICDPFSFVSDMVVSFGLPKVKPAVQHEQIQRLLVECQQTNDYSKETKELATWAIHLSRGM